MESTYLGGQLAELFENSESADVALHCAGQVIKAHSVILAMRSPYFKTALNTDVGSNNQSSRKRTKGIQNQLEVKECSPEVLSTTIKFIYGIGLPGDLSVEDAKDLLTIADLYIMEDLKEAVAPVLGAQLDKDNILEISKMAEKCTASKLMEICVDFIVSNITDPDEIFAGMPQIAALCFKKQLKKLEIVNMALETDLKINFKKRKDFRYDVEYKDYLMKNLKSGMLVTNKKTLWEGGRGVYEQEVKEGSIGRILSSDTDGASVKWFVKPYSGCHGVELKSSISLLDLDICAPSFNTTFFR